MGGPAPASAGFKGVIVALVIISATASLGGKWVSAQVHHVVGGDRGWDPASDLTSWSSGRVFKVGDQIWFTYSVAQGLIAELESREEYESCNASNPIRMYTDGLHIVPLEREGIRYFVSTDPHNCSTGLKLHVHVLPLNITSNTTTPKVEAAAPTTPSASARYGHKPVVLMPVLMFCLALGLAY